MPYDETEPITLPGTIPGLLRRCSPVVHETIDHEDWDDGDDPPLVKVRAVLGLLRYGGALASVSYEQSGVPLQEDEVPIEGLALDLEDETGRAHACLWLLGQGNAAAWWARMWLRQWSEGSARDWSECTSSKFPLSAAIQGITNDPTLLPDGSRRVDALVLQAVCLHVGGAQ